MARAGEPELFDVFEDELGGMRPLPLGGPAPQDRVLRHSPWPRMEEVSGAHMSLHRIQLRTVEPSVVLPVLQGVRTDDHAADTPFSLGVVEPSEAFFAVPSDRVPQRTMEQTSSVEVFGGVPGGRVPQRTMEQTSPVEAFRGVHVDRVQQRIQEQTSSVEVFGGVHVDRVQQRIQEQIVGIVNVVLSPVVEEAVEALVGVPAVRACGADFAGLRWCSW